ncbi:unnamed protein product [Acanthoscelides obtectus]|uniref:Uncharacterized protein n=1 Tax=Acanthoscelides obtectus TaxID=200917 RepID=A0A9P0M2Y7_ACAOB|nr:unnamed protein product [Acanthoscelides obtectus]CAK1637892.1 hypothetical protein AOBTE_LOCUS10267 [Acanthoscelides obtectus]
MYLGICIRFRTSLKCSSSLLQNSSLAELWRNSYKRPETSCGIPFAISCFSSNSSSLLVCTHLSTVKLEHTF